MTNVSQYLARIRDERAACWNEAEGLIARAQDEQRSQLEGWERARLADLNERMDQLDDEERGWTDRADHERAADAARAPHERFVRSSTHGGATEMTMTDDGFTSFLRSSESRIPGSSYMLQQATRDEYRALNEFGTPSAGGTAIGVSVSKTLMDYLESASPIRAVARMLTTSSGEPMILPRVATGGTAIATGEGTAFAGTDPTFAGPRIGAYKYGELVIASNELIEDVQFNLAEFVARDLGRALGRVTGALYATGNGTTQPQGYATVGASNGTVTGGTGVGGAPSFDGLVDVYHRIDAQYAGDPSAAWLMSLSAHASIWKLKDSQSRPIFVPSVSAGVPDSLLGRPVFVDPNLPAVGLGAESVFFGAWNYAYCVRDVRGVEVVSSSDAYFAQDQTAWRGRLRTDGKIMDARAFATFKGAAS